MAPSISHAIPARQNITLFLAQDNNGLKGAVILSLDNHLSVVFRGKLAEALKEAEAKSVEYGFSGYYGISGIDDLKALKLTDLSGVFGEINRQSVSLQQKVGASWGSGVRRSPAEIADMHSAAAQMTSLAKLRDALMRNL